MPIGDIVPPWAREPIALAIMGGVTQRASWLALVVLDGAAPRLYEAPSEMTLGAVLCGLVGDTARAAQVIDTRPPVPPGESTVLVLLYRTTGAGCEAGWLLLRREPLPPPMLS